MRTIFIRIQETNRRGATVTSRHAVSLDRSRHPTVGQWLAHAVRVCGLSENGWEVEVEGYRISPMDTSRMLESAETYVLRRRRAEREESEEEEEQEELGKKVVEVSKRKQKVDKVKEKNGQKRKAESSESSESSESEDESEQESSSESPMPVIKPKQQVPLQKPISDDKRSRARHFSSSSSSSSLEQPLPKLNPPKAVIKKAISPRPMPKNAPSALKKKPVSSSSEEPSDSDSTPLAVKPTSSKPKGPVVAKPAAKQVRRLPAALRNQTAAVGASFRAHQESQWLGVGREQLRAWKEGGKGATICRAGNRIRFRVVELDEERFVPVKSEWISGEVKAVGEDGKVELAGVEQEGKPYRSSYQLAEHNMDELQIHRTLATKQQLELLAEGKAEQQQQERDRQVAQEVAKVAQEQPPAEVKGGGSLQAYVCGQVNYYFSDKNYSTDLYMQMHANRHPNKELPYVFLLNFPKIKKVLTDEHKLGRFLENDPKYATRNFLLNPQNRTIRKKVGSEAGQAHSTQEEAKEAEKSKEEGEVGAGSEAVVAGEEPVVGAGTV